MMNAIQWPKNMAAVYHYLKKRRSLKWTENKWLLYSTNDLLQKIRS